MGSPSISLRGRAGTSPAVTASGGDLPLLVADPAAGRDAMQAAREVLQRIDGVLADNAEPLRGTIANLNTFSGALARNSDRLDGIIEGLERLTGGGTKAAPPTYDLSAPREFPPSGKAPHGQLVVAEPNALLAMDTQKISIRPAKGESPPTLNGQWSENLPKLVQEKIIQSFENANYLGAVARPLDGLTADYQLLLDIRNFQISQSPEPTAEVEYGAKILGPNGKIVAARIFRATAPAKSLDPAAAVAAFDEAFGKTATELVLWTSEVVL
jgi:phospholipid/cholesterol/gamma-HCH transport system substrate-binding protein